MKEYLNNNVIQYQQQGEIEYIQFNRLLEYPELTHCYTLRSEGKLNFPPIYKDEIALKQSYERISEVLHLDITKIVKPHQTHTNHVEKIDQTLMNELNEKRINSAEKLDQVDGMITNQKEITLLTTSADCTSLLFFDPIKKVIGSVHSGWKGTLYAIAKNTVEKMIKEYNCNPKEIICGICPTIRQCCFEVDEEVKDLFEKEYSNLEKINQIILKGNIVEEKQKYYIDTVEINKQLLENAGLKPENILDSGICTKCHSDDFHSYRVDKEFSGRNAAVICQF